MAWHILTVADLNTKMSASEVAQIQELVPVAEIQKVFTQTTDLVRGYVSANPANKLGAEGTIPSRLLDATLDLLIPKLYGITAGLMIDLNQVRTAALERAERLLRDVARGDFQVEPVLTGESEARSSSVEYVLAETTLLSAESLRGL